MNITQLNKIAVKNLSVFDENTFSYIHSAEKVDRSHDEIYKKHSLTTEQLASQLGIGAQSIRKRFSQTGSYYDLRPIKLPNRRLLWPSNSIQVLTKNFT